MNVGGNGKCRTSRNIIIKQEFNNTMSEELERKLWEFEEEELGIRCLETRLQNRNGEELGRRE